MDLQAPLVHEFTYQAMANDLLPIEDGTKYSCVYGLAICASQLTQTVLVINSNLPWGRTRTK